MLFTLYVQSQAGWIPLFSRHDPACQLATTTQTRGELDGTGWVWLLPLVGVLFPALVLAEQLLASSRASEPRYWVAIRSVAAPALACVPLLFLLAVVNACG